MEMEITNFFTSTFQKRQIIYDSADVHKEVKGSCKEKPEGMNHNNCTIDINKSAHIFLLQL